MTQSGQDADRPVPRSGTPKFEKKMAFRLIALALVNRVLHNPRFYEGLAVGAVVLAGLGRIGQENRVSTMARLSAWNQRELERLERKAKRLEQKVERDTRAVKGTGQMVRAGAKAPGELPR